MLESCLCTQAQLESDAFAAWAERMRPAWNPDGSGRRVNLHRKLWEWIFIAQALSQRGLLAPGKRGVGFGVGREPQAALFASLGCEVLATDLAATHGGARLWSKTGQHAPALSTLNEAGLCPPAEFERRVRFRAVDMNRIPEDLRGFDFAWSSCAFEHLGNIVRGQEFILRQMECLKPGGVAVHTTEFNLSSNTHTVDWAGTVLFRRRDIEELAGRLRQAGHRVDLDFDPGRGPADEHVDAPPFGPLHLKLWLKGFQVTSLGLVITKGDGAARRAEPGLAERAWRDARSGGRAVDTGVTLLRLGLERLRRNRRAART